MTARSFTRRRSWTSAVLCGGLVLLAACSDKNPTEVVPTPSPQLANVSPTVPAPQVEQIYVCKDGPAGTYDFTADITSGSVLQQNGTDPVLLMDTDKDGHATFTVDAGDCIWLALTGGPTRTVSITELPHPLTAFSSATVAQLKQGVVTTTTVGNPATANASGSDLEGAVVVFYNRDLQADVSLSKTADAAQVTAGSNIGFTITVASNGPDPANNVAISDVLPTGPGISWSIDSQPAGDPCSIASGTLNCALGSMAAGATATIHITSATTSQSCGIYDNTANLTADNTPSLSASASMEVTCPNTPCPAGSFSYSYNAAGDLLIKYDQFPAPNDNSYGVNAVGWPRGHRFSDLTGSDKAGFQLRDPNGVIKLSFNVDYLSADATQPSGYGSLGVSGGDGKMVVGTSSGIIATTSLANNLNNINIPGLFVNKVQQFGSVNLLIDSPPTDAQHQTYNISDPLLVGWDFHDTYYVTVTAAKLASIGFDPNTWTVEPNLTVLHNSPPKPCPVASGPCALSVTKYEVKDKQVKVTIANGNTVDQFLTQLSLNWPAANGKLMQVKLGGDVIYDKPDIAAGPVTLTTAELVSDQNKRKIGKISSKVLTLIFEKNADPNLANYTGTVDFGDCSIVILPN